MILRIGGPQGEVVFEGMSKAERDFLFDAFSKIGWLVEERKASDRRKQGWVGAPLRTSRPEG